MFRLGRALRFVRQRKPKRPRWGVLLTSLAGSLGELLRLLAHGSRFLA